MELIVFDLDGTLLNNASEISPFTRETLQRLTERDIAYTVATGRTLHSGQEGKILLPIMVLTYLTFIVMV